MNTYKEEQMGTTKNNIIRIFMLVLMLTTGFWMVSTAFKVIKIKYGLN